VDGSTSAVQQQTDKNNFIFGQGGLSAPTPPDFWNVGGARPVLQELTKTSLPRTALGPTTANSKPPNASHSSMSLVTSDVLQRSLAPFYVSSYSIVSRGSLGPEDEVSGVRGGWHPDLAISIIEISCAPGAWGPTARRTNKDFEPCNESSGHPRDANPPFHKGCSERLAGTLHTHSATSLESKMHTMHRYSIVLNGRDAVNIRNANVRVCGAVRTCTQARVNLGLTHAHGRVCSLV